MDLECHLLANCEELRIYLLKVINYKRREKREITTVKEVCKCDLDYHKIW